MIEQNEEVVEETTEENNDQSIEQEIENVIDESKFDSAGNDGVIKIDLDAPPPKQEEVVEEQKENVEEKPEVTEDQPVMEDVSNQEEQEVIEETIPEQEDTEELLPENIQKVVQFMEETGGDLSDYVNLNRDIENMDDSDVLDEYYRDTKSHLSAEERNFLLEDKFGVDEDIDDERAARKKKIALKEQVAEARAYLDGQKSKYYEDIKAVSKLTEEQQQAIDFFNRYNK